MDIKWSRYFSCHLTNFSLYSIKYGLYKIVSCRNISDDGVLIFVKGIVVKKFNTFVMDFNTWVETTKLLNAPDLFSIKNRKIFCHVTIDQICWNRRGDWRCIRHAHNNWRRRPFSRSCRIRFESKRDAENREWSK